MTRRDKAAPLAVKGMAYGKSGVSAITVMGEVWGIYAVVFVYITSSSVIRSTLHIH